jgi:MFS family permease
LGLGTAMVYPALLASAADIAPPAKRATTLGWYRFWRDLGYPAGALLAGIISGLFGLAWAVAVAAALTCISGFVAAWFMRRRDEVLVGSSADRVEHAGVANREQT